MFIWSSYHFILELDDDVASYGRLWVIHRKSLICCMRNMIQVQSLSRPHNAWIQDLHAKCENTSFVRRTINKKNLVCESKRLPMWVASKITDLSDPTEVQRILPENEFSFLKRKHDVTCPLPVSLFCWILKHTFGRCSEAKWQTIEIIRFRGIKSAEQSTFFCDDLHSMPA